MSCSIGQNEEEKKNKNKNSFILNQNRQLMTTDSTDLLPLTNTPEVFGLHPNAEINYYSHATQDIWNHLIELQPQTGEFFFLFYFSSQLFPTRLENFFVVHKWRKSLCRD